QAVPAVFSVSRVIHVERNSSSILLLVWSCIQKTENCAQCYTFNNTIPVSKFFLHLILQHNFDKITEEAIVRVYYQFFKLWAISTPQAIKQHVAIRCELSSATKKVDDESGTGNFTCSYASQ
ncbi:hypothetical protein Bhyg_12216, partial [Pseudolycoriella hygida]